MQRKQVLRKLAFLGLIGASAALTLTSLALPQVRAQDPLPSWNEGPSKQAIVSFVQKVTDKSNPEYVSPADRIATFDQDGTLWVEHPLYAQAMFALERVHELAAKRPEWRTEQPFKAVLANDREAIARFTEQDWAKIIGATHAGMTTEAFHDIAQEWLGRARDPRFKRPYTELAYQPMLEVMQYLRANGFKTYIVTGGGQEFVRVYSERGCGVPPEQVVGSSIATKYEYQDGNRCCCGCPRCFSSTTRLASPWASICSSASALWLRSAIQGATGRCWSIPGQALGRGL